MAHKIFHILLLIKVWYCVLIESLWNVQLNNNKEDKDKVVILLLDMLEVVTRDMMEDPTPK